jgi:hypothetical protein
MKKIPINIKGDNRPYQISNEIMWSVEASYLIIVNRSTDEVIELKYPEAALWDLLQRPYNKKKLILQIAAIISCDESCAELFIGHSVKAWRKAGLLQS